MKIIKKFQGTIPENKIVSTYTDTYTDTYSCKYINDLATINSNNQIVPSKQIKFDSGYRTYSDAGYFIDAYGNFRHLTADSTNWFGLMDTSGDAKLKYYWDTGRINVNGQDVLIPYVIYESQGTSTSFSLSQNTNDYQYLEIYYATNDVNSMSCRKVKVNTNGTTMASLDYWYTLSGTMYFKQANVDISGTSVTFKNNSQCGLGVAYSDGSYIYILRIVGYK